MKMLKKLMWSKLLELTCFLPVCFFLLMIASCNNSDPTPKPKGYYRIEFPAKNYREYTPDNCPFMFEYPTYAEIRRDSTFFDRKTPNPCWLNLAFPQFNGTIHISYKPIGKDESLVKLIEDMHKMTFKHTVKAEYIDKRKIEPKSDVTGLLYEVGGNAASSTQFFVTDSNKHFLRGALYFNTRPNEDSLAPVVKFVKDDIQHMVKTFRWTDSTWQKNASLR